LEDSLSSDAIRTIRYQLTVGGLKKHYQQNDQQISSTLQSAIEVASESTSAGIALSIGPFGADLSPGQEYTGFYPPPYGPSSSQNTSPSNAFSSEEEERKAENALMESHLERLSMYSADEDTWSKVVWVAFETIPVVAEIRAVRRAMKSLENSGRGKKFWITSAFPEGRHPQMTQEGGRVGAEDILLAALGGGDDMAPADGVGINCTNPHFLPTLTTSFSNSLQKLREEGRVTTRATAFLLYPDGGKIYDPVKRDWSGGLVDPATWAGEILDIADTVRQATDGSGKSLWSEVIVGGCCNASFDHIKALRQQVDQRSSS
jgi:homocysteine S-methyltransferase